MNKNIEHALSTDLPRWAKDLENMHKAIKAAKEWREGIQGSPECGEVDRKSNLIRAIDNYYQWLGDESLPLEIVPELNTEIEALREEIAKLRELLIDSEWHSFDDEWGEKRYCWKCESSKSKGHAPDCCLAEALKKVQL
jgi:hypothetical protein